MRKKSVLLRSAASGAIVLGAFAAALPANAASAPMPSSSTASSVSPASVGSILCNGDLCIQRITSIVNGKASVKAWAWKTNFTGTFYLEGAAEGYSGQSPTQKWIAGGTGHVFPGVPQGGDYVAAAWNSTEELGQVYFGV
jgi:hypothetical protein